MVIGVFTREDGWFVVELRSKTYSCVLVVLYFMNDSHKLQHYYQLQFFTHFYIYLACYMPSKLQCFYFDDYVTF